MAVREMACTVPLSAAINYLNIAKTPIYPYKGLTDLHQGFGRIRQYPLEIWLAFPGLAQSFEIVEWLFVGCALVFFLIFGLTEEARRHYISECTAVAKFLHVMPSTKDPQELHWSGPLTLCFRDHSNRIYVVR